jgi:hypothetical protein
MKKILKAFTYIELIVVISIITLLSTTWVFYFLEFVKSQEINQKVNTIDMDFKELDKKIKSFEIFDYEIQLNTVTWALWYINMINNFDLPYNQYINFDSTSWSGILWTNWNISQTWDLKIYKKIKLYLSEGIQSSTFYAFNFNDEPFYKITGFLSGELLNEININYFTEDNIDSKKNNLLILSKINTKIDKTGTSIISLSIKNIWWNKSIIWDWLKINEAYLFFDNNWKEKFIYVNK